MLVAVVGFGFRSGKAQNEQMLCGLPPKADLSPDLRTTPAASSWRTLPWQRGALRPYVEFISDAWHREDESGLLWVRLYLTPQAGHEHIDAAVIGFRATPRNGVTELVP